MSDIPVRLRPRALVPAGWPADVAPNQIITAAHINAIRSSVYAWPGDVDGQGHTLSNVHLAGVTGVLADPTTTAGDLIARGASAIGRLPVGSAGQVLTVDAAAPAKLRWATPATAPVASVFGRLGAVVAQAGDYTAAQVTGAVVDSLTTKGDIFARGAAATGRFPAGADGQVLRADASQAFGLRWSGESVPSVFGRTGPIAAQAGDYTAAQVQDAVSVLGSYPDPAWLPSLSWTKLIGAPASFPPAAHTHDAAAVISGVLATARLGTGVADATVYLRGDGTWAAAGTGGGGGVVSVFGRAGTVVAQTGDYTAAQVTGAVVNPTAIKGDLMVRNDLNSIVRLPVGASGQVLQADTSLTTGMKWTNISAAVQTPWVTDVDAANFQLINVRRLGVAIALPAFPLDVVGDINFTGTLRQNGVAVSFGGSQTPWTSDIDGNTKTLFNVGQMSLGSGSPGGYKLFVAGGRSVFQGADPFTLGVSNSAGTSTPFWVGTSSTDDLVISASSGTERVRVQQSGNVGIGTATPSAGSRLAVVGGDIDLAEQVANRAIGFFVNGPGGRFTDTNGVSNSRYGITYHGGVPGYSVGLSGWGGLRFYTQDSERVTIDASGNVGIGTTTPGQRLEIASSTFVDTYLAVNVGGERLRVGMNFSTGLPADNFGAAQVLTESGGNLMLSTRTNNPSNILFYTCAAAAAVERMRITSAGLVGIGKTPTTYRVEVAGDIDITGSFRVNGVPKMVMTASAPDEVIGNGQTSIWFDEATNRLTVRYRNTAGVLKTGYLPME